MHALFHASHPADVAGAWCTLRSIIGMRTCALVLEERAALQREAHDTVLSGPITSRPRDESAHKNVLVIVPLGTFGGINPANVLLFLPASHAHTLQI